MSIELFRTNAMAGTILSTTGALETFDETYIQVCFRRHFSGDWGDIPDDDADLNQQALSSGDRIQSGYTDNDGRHIWIVTDAGWNETDRSLYGGHPIITTALLPEEY